MQYRSFKNTGTELSLLGFGAMRLPVRNKVESDIDEEKALEMIGYAYENGVNYFDTAYIYHGRNAEAFLGKALGRYRRESYHLATKMPPWNIEKKENLQRIFDEQLKNCGVDYFDFYLMHCITRTFLPLFEKLETWEFMLEQKKKGKIRYLGFSHHDNVDILTQAIDKWPVDFAQIQLNYLDWEQLNAKGLYETLWARGIPCIVMEPVRGGLLASLPKDSAKILQEADPTRSAASWAMRFCGDLPGVATVLSGMSTMEQVKDNVATFKNFAPLSSAEREAINRTVDVYRKNAMVPCTVCRYCMPCPEGVEIPHSMAIYNAYKSGDTAEHFLNEYALIGKGSFPHKCTGCGVCLERCPQHIDIPVWMKEIAKTKKDLGG